MVKRMVEHCIDCAKTDREPDYTKAVTDYNPFHSETYAKSAHWDQFR